VPIPSREDQYAVTVSVAGVSLGTFDKLSGGELDSEETKYRPGGMGAEVALGGPKTVSNVTVSRIYSLDGDHAANLASLKAAIGKGAVTITKQPLDADGNAYGSPVVYNGILKNVKLPDHDSQSNDPGMLELEVSTNATVS
jgi:hypothetical protein